MFPSGKITFLFTDIESSTKIAQQHPEGLNEFLQAHNSLINKAVNSNNGFVFKTAGDAFFCSFADSADAVKASRDIQKRLTEIKTEGIKLKVRIGIHTGAAEWNGEDYMGYITLARTQRIMSAAHGGQILISDKTYENLKENKLDNLTFRDLGERRLKDMIQPLRLYQICADDLPSEFPPLKTLDERPNNLPVQLTNFIGREKEIAEVKYLLTKTRLLTLTGPGGTGKTRLSLQVGADIIDEFSSGVMLVELAPVSDPDLVALTIARTLGINELPNQDTETVIVDYLKNREMLIILDNCEHLIDTCAKITEKLLQKCPKLKIIATSREALRSDGEITHKVLSLDHPEPDEKCTLIQLTQYEAVRLFIERALAVNPGFRVNNENAPALAQICHQLDGIPLAIELAAVRINVLSVEKIREKLNDRFKLLTGGRRTALPRQQTLKALIDWSYDLLNEKEKILLQRLSVFSGGWTLEAAEEICIDDKIESYDIIDIQTTLMDKSLINSVEKTGMIRFYLLETIKQYAEEKLCESTDLKNKHLNYFRKLSDHEKMRLNGINQTEWIRLTEADYDNIRSAIQYASENNPQEAFIILSDMTNYWSIKGFFQEGLQTCQKVLNNNPGEVGIFKARVLYSAGLLSYGLGYSAEAENYARESLAMFRDADFKEGIGISLNLLGVSLNLNINNSDEVVECLNESLSVLTSINRKREISNVLYNLSFPFLKKGDYEKALRYREESLEIARELNDTHFIAVVTTSLGISEFRRDNFEKAREYTEESLINSRLLGDKYLISINMISLGNIYSESGEYEKANEYLEEAVRISNDYGYKSNLIVALLYSGEVASKTGDDIKAVSCFKESILTGKETGIDFYLGNNFYGLGISYFNLKEYEKSIKYLSFFKTLFDSNNIYIKKKKIPEAETYMSMLRDKLGDGIYDRLSSEALNCSKEEAIRFSLES